MNYWNSTIKIKKKEKPKKKKRIKLPTISSLVKKADKVFSLFIRQRDGKCVLCGSITNLNNGHLYKRSKKLLRYDEFNCNALCYPCNFKDNYEHDHYVNWFLKKYGAEKYQQLYIQSDELHKWTRDELTAIIEKYTV